VYRGDEGTGGVSSANVSDDDDLLVETVL